MAEPKNILLFSTADWNAEYWTNKQHTTAHLAKLGFRVLYIESPGLRAPKLTSGRDLGRIYRRLLSAVKGVKNVRKNVWIMSPLQIPIKHHWPIVRYLNQGIQQFLLWRFIKKHNFLSPIVWSYHPFIMEAIAKLQYAKLVYHNVDDLSAIPGIEFDAFRNEEVKFLKQCDIVFTSSQHLKEFCDKYNDNVHFFPNVVDFDHFSSAHLKKSLPDDLKNIPKPILMYIGVLSDFKINFVLLEETISLTPNWQWVFIGQEREGQVSASLDRIKSMANTYFLGYRDYEVLPDYLRGANVGLLPSLVNQYTAAMFPMKYFEYLAAGVPVVSTPLAFTETHSAGIEVFQDAVSMISAVEKQLSVGKLELHQSSEYVGDNTWPARLKKMLHLLDV